MMNGGFMFIKGDKMSYTWIKLYNEILDDPKMGMLPDRIWRRIIELFLFAGKEGKGGALPSIQTMAWTLHASPADLAIDMLDIESLGIIEQNNNSYTVKNFTRRQAAMGVTERVRRFRAGETKKLQPGNKKVSEEEVEEEKEEEEDGGEARALIFDLYEKEIGVLSSFISQELIDYANLPEEWLRKAFSEAVANNVRKWSYVRAILKSWVAAGRILEEKKGNQKQPALEPVNNRPAPSGI